jgi:hypothetical protein
MAEALYRNKRQHPLWLISNPKFRHMQTDVARSEQTQSQGIKTPTMHA